jgi:hypothetical protein
MELFQDIQPLTIVLVIAGLVLGWVLLRILLKFTVRVFACGCLVLLLVGGGAYLLTALVG